MHTTNRAKQHNYIWLAMFFTEGVIDYYQGSGIRGQNLTKTTSVSLKDEKKLWHHHEHEKNLRMYVKTTNFNH